MALCGVIEVVSSDTKPTMIQFLENSEPLDITGYSIVARIGTSTVTERTATIVDAANGEASVLLGGIAAGTYKSEFRISVGGLSQTSELFTLISRAAL
jgi:hypothetical protein